MPAFDPANRLPSALPLPERVPLAGLRPSPAGQGLQWEKVWLPPAESGCATWGYDGGPVVPVSFLAHLFRRRPKTV